MLDRTRTPWNPDPRWADPLIVMLALLVLSLTGMSLAARKARPAVPTRVGTQARVLDALVALEGLQPTPGRRSADAIHQLSASRNPWERAMAAVLAAEAGQREQAATLASDPALDPDFRIAWLQAYAAGPRSSSPDTDRLAQALGHGTAALHLDARLKAVASGRPAPDLEPARAYARRALAAFALLGIGLVTVLLGGIAFTMYLAITRTRRPEPSPAWEMSGRALLLVLLGWFLAMQFSGLVAQLLIRVLPVLRPLGLTLAYGVHAAVGITLVLRAEGLTWREAMGRLHRAQPLRAFLEGLGFYALAVLSVLVVGLAASPFMPKDAAPQQELMDTMTRVKGLLPVGLLFLTVAGLAPFFEEFIFRGALLGWLRTRTRPLGAVAISGLAFALIHLQPAALPTHTTLGLVLGLACLRTGSFWSSVLVHTLWNGGIFLLVRAAG